MRIIFAIVSFLIAAIPLVWMYLAYTEFESQLGPYEALQQMFLTNPNALLVALFLIVSCGFFYGGAHLLLARPGHRHQ